MPDSYRARVYRLIFSFAAAYNILFGLWAAGAPQSFFRLFALDPPRYPAIWGCLGMVVGLYGLAYAYAARHLDRAAPFIALGLAGKLLGPIGWVMAVRAGELPPRTFLLIAFNDLLWWVPFGLFLLEGTRVATRIRNAAPILCAGLNFVAALAMATILRPGTEMVADVDMRLSYIASHRALWRAGWFIWIGAAISLLGFYAWWGSFIRSRRVALIAFTVAAAGLVCDLFAESLLIAWLPMDYRRIAPLTTVLTGGAANGLYTVAGVILTLATPLPSRGMAVWTWAIWVMGGSLSVAALIGSPAAIAVATATLFTLFCPWVLVLGRTLTSRMPAAR